jgi:putative ABC transport system permease protein
MNSRYFVRLALQSIDKHRQTYVPYMVAVSSFVSMFYLLLFLRDNVIATQDINATVFNYMLSVAVYAFGFFVVVFLIYSNSFLIRPRTKEFGLLYLLGLTQRHLLVIMAYEVVITYSVSIVFGLVSGVVLSRLLSMILSALIKVPVMMQQIIDLTSIGVTAGLFLGVMCIVLVINMTQIISAKPISLIRHTNPPKASIWRQYILLLGGIVSTGYAYWSISSIDSPQRAYELIASIVLAILIGTYCLFVSLSVTVLQILSRRPTVYYQTKNLIIINGLLNRIQFNAIGLASVSMFALLILTMVSMAGVIYFGANESVQKMYAADIIVTIQEYNIESKKELHERIDQEVAAQGIKAQVSESYVFVSLSAQQSGNSFTYDEQNRSFVGSPTSHYIVLITVNEYNSMYGESLVLAPNEVAVYSSYRILPDTFALQGITYRIVKRLPQVSIANYDLEQLVNAHYVVVHDESVLQTHALLKFQQNADHPSPLRYRMGMQLTGSESQKLATYHAIESLLMTNPVISRVQQFPNPYVDIVHIQSRQAEKMIFEAVYGTLLFLSLFLGVLFMMSTALLIYYKQLSEGYEDKARFEILQRIGMTRDEVRMSVDKQIVVLFFIPLLVASIHFIISLHLIKHLLELFRIENQQLMLSAAVITLMIYSIMYLIIYRVSARVYYTIVR